jgi:hypothetical protein
VDHTVRSIDVVNHGNGALYPAARAAVTAQACALAEPALPLGSQGTDKGWQVTLSCAALLCTCEVVACGLVNTGVVESDCSIGLTAIHDGHHLNTPGGVDGSVVA